MRRVAEPGAAPGEGFFRGRDLFPDVRIEILTSWDGESWDKISVRKKIHAARKLLLRMDTALISPDPEARAALRLASQVTDVNVFLAVQNSSIGDLVTQSLTKDFTNCHTKNNPIDFRPPRHLIRVMRRHVLTYKKTETMTKTKTNTTKTPFENLRF